MTPLSAYGAPPPRYTSSADDLGAMNVGDTRIALRRGLGPTGGIIIGLVIASPRGHLRAPLSLGTATALFVLLGLALDILRHGVPASTLIPPDEGDQT
ncbi:MAG TPA: hypothetical protein VGM56_32150 [Byssovorax sp.]